MLELRRLLDESGVRVIENCEMKNLRSSGSQATAVETSHAELEADEVLVATGSWTPLLKDALGVKLPIQPGKGYSITMARRKSARSIP